MPEPVSITHEGYLEILVTVLGVLATVFSILIAVLGAIGYGSVKQSAREAAEVAAKKQAQDAFDAILASTIEDLVRKAVTTALITENARLRSDEQAADLSLDQAADRNRTTNRTMDNIVLRPKKRVFKDPELGDDAS